MLLPGLSFAQSNINSPYSRYGLGDLSQPVFAAGQGLASTGMAMQNDSLTPYFIHVQNPASYASARITCFEAGVHADWDHIQGGGASQLYNNSGLRYISFLFPIAKYWSSSVGILPFSTVGYRTQMSQQIDSIGDVRFYNTGSGGINRVYFGNGFRIKNISVGCNVSYLFGQITDTARISFPAASYFDTRKTNTLQVHDLYVDLGLQYAARLNTKWKMVVGISGSFPQMLSGSKNFYAENMRSGLVKDTVTYYENKPVQVEIPYSAGLGVMISKGRKLSLLADYSIQRWSANTSAERDAILKDQKKFSVGIQFIPDPSLSASSTYFRKVIYRAGFRHTGSYLNINGYGPREQVLAAGISLPIGRNRHMDQYSMLNIGCEALSRGTVDHDLVKETALRMTIGITFNSRWFIQPKID